MADDKFFYSRKNPNGPYTGRTRPNDSAPKEKYIEGQSTQKNIDQWANYSLQNSDDPSIKKSK